MPTTESECLIALQRAADRLGEPPTKAQSESLDLRPSAATILRVVGGWNAARERAGLLTNSSTGSRVQPKPDDVSIPDDETWAELSQDQRWHYRNVAWNTERSLRRRSRKRRWLRDRKGESDGCSRCDEDDPACLNFHHREPDEKRMAVNEMVLYSYGRDRIREELAQCDILCANCHRREHAPSQWDDVRPGGDTADTGSPGDEMLQTRELIRAWSRSVRANRAVGTVTRPIHGAWSSTTRTPTTRTEPSAP